VLIAHVITIEESQDHRSYKPVCTCGEFIAARRGTRELAESRGAYHLSVVAGGPPFPNLDKGGSK
jgi:hypothetical protein